jgi:hypothetical protein
MDNVESYDFVNPYSKLMVVDAPFGFTKQFKIQEVYVILLAGTVIAVGTAASERCINNSSRKKI